MDTRGTYSLRPMVLVVDELVEMEKMIRGGLLACSAPLSFCSGVPNEVISQITTDQPTLIIAPLQMGSLNAVQLMQSVIQKTGEPIPGIFIQNSPMAEVERQLAALSQVEFFPRQFHMAELLKRIEILVGSAPTRRQYRTEHFLSPLSQKKTTAA